MRASLVANAVHLGSILFILDDAHEGNRDVIGRQCQNVPVPRNCLLSRDPHVFNIACERYSLGLTLYPPVRKDIYLLNVNILLVKLLLDCVFTKRLKPKPQQVL